MNVFRQFIVGAVLATGLSGCSTLLPQSSRTDVLSSIQKGMSKQEVIDILGTPEYRRFDRNTEEWEFTRDLYGNSDYTKTQIVISFEDERVVAMDSFSKRPEPVPEVPGGIVIDPSIPIYVKGMHPQEFQRLYEKVKSRLFKDEQLEMLSVVSRNNRLTCRQCARLMSLFSFDDEKLQVLKMFAPGIVDLENYDEILDVIDSLFKEEDAKKILGIRR